MLFAKIRQSWQLVLVDPLLFRFNEWGKAVMSIQLQRLQGNQGHEYFYSAYFGDDEAKDLQTLSSEIAGCLMSAASSSLFECAIFL